VRSGGEPVAARCATSGKTGSPSGVRQSETRPRRLPLANAQTEISPVVLAASTMSKQGDRADGRFRVNIDAKPLDHIFGYALRVSA